MYIVIKTKAQKTRGKAKILQMAWGTKFTTYSCILSILV